MKHYNDISDFNRDLGINPPKHPLFSIDIGHDNNDSTEDIIFTAGFYIISFRKFVSGNITYGKREFDHARGRMIFFKPHQIITFKNVKAEDDCFLITVHPDYLSGTALQKEIKNYSFFDYETNEALYLRPDEEETIWHLVRTMNKEVHNNTDDYSRPILLAHLGTVLTYSQRFYKRQFINRIEMTGALASRFQHLLNDYYNNHEMLQSGLPTVSYMADKLSVSPRYLSDILKQETGKTALELIHIHLVNEAKNLLAKGDMNISEISFSLGFENPNYFARLFKKEVGITPNAFKDKRLN